MQVSISDISACLMTEKTQIESAAASLPLSVSLSMWAQLLPGETSIEDSWIAEITHSEL